jgi:hypothetical protein
VVYAVAIRIGFQQRTYAIPAVALALNIAWETIYATRGLVTGDLSVQTFVNVAWALADVVIVYTFLRYGRGELPDFVSRPMFVLWAGLIFTSAYAIQWLFVVEFGWGNAPKYAAFLQNLLMSGLFIAMFMARRGPRAKASCSRSRSGLAPLLRRFCSAPLPDQRSSSGWASCAASLILPTSACWSGRDRD